MSNASNAPPSGVVGCNSRLIRDLLWQKRPIFGAKRYNAQGDSLLHHFATTPSAMPIYPPIQRQETYRPFIGQLHKILLNAASRPQVKWDDPVVGSIEWNSTYSAVCHLSITARRFVTKLKLIHTLLPIAPPIGTRLCQRLAHMPTRCPSCENPIQWRTTDRHWIYISPVRITCPSHAEWRTTQEPLLSSSTNYPQHTNTQAGLKIILLRAFRSLLTTGTCALDPAPCHLLWRRLLSSFWYKPTEWSTIQNKHVKAEKLNWTKYSGTIWSYQFIKYKGVHSISSGRYATNPCMVPPNSNT
jgi:hypothetical protein